MGPSRRRFLLLFLGLSALHCDDGGTIRRIESGFFNPSSVDFGVRAIGEPHGLPVTLTNTSGQRLLIQKIATDPPINAYTARQLEGGALTGVTLSNGQSIEVEVLFGPIEPIAYNTKLVLVTEDLELLLDLKGEGAIIPPAAPAASPNTLQFGTMEIGRERVLDVLITNDGERPGRIDRVESAAPFFVLQPDGTPATPSPMLAPGENFRLAVHFRPSREAPFSRDILFKMGNQETTVVAEGTGVPPGSLQCPGQVDLGAVPRGDTARMTVDCMVDGLFTLDSATLSANSSFRLENLTSSGNVRFDLVFVSRGLPAVVQDTITFSSDSGETFSLPVRAEVTPPNPANTDLNITIAWETDTDFDLHLTRGSFLPFSNQDCHFGNRTLEWGIMDYDLDDPHLDQDDTGGFGLNQETMNLVEAPSDVYNIYVHFYEAKLEMGPTPLTLEYRVAGGAPTTLNRTFMPSQCGLMWYVGTVDYQGAQPSFQSIDMDENRWPGMCR